MLTEMMGFFWSDTGCCSSRMPLVTNVTGAWFEPVEMNDTCSSLASNTVCDIGYACYYMVRTSPGTVQLQ